MYTALFLMRCFIILLYGHIRIVCADQEAVVINSAKCDKPIDLVFAIDVTSSINKAERLDMLYFIENVVQGFNISNSKTHVAVLTFNNKITIFTELTAEKETFNKVMLKLQYLQPKGFAFTHRALKKADSIFTNGSRNSTSTKALVLLTDSSCNNKNECPVPVENVARQLNAAGIDIFAVSLSKTSVKEMTAIGSQPGNKHIHANNFKALRDSRFTSDVRKLICTVPACFCYNLTDCDKKTRRCKRIPACDGKHFFREGESFYTGCCNDNEVCGTGFTYDKSKNKYIAIPSINLTSRSSNSTSSSVNSTPPSANSELTAGVVTAVLLFVIVVTFLFFFFKRYKRQKATPESSQQQYVNSEFKMPSQEEIYYSAVGDTNSKPQETAGEMYAELGSGGGRIGGERTSVVESHYREALHYDDVKKLGP